MKRGERVQARGEPGITLARPRLDTSSVNTYDKRENPLPTCLL
ncbi:MAG TPA: hypothetical protein VFV38_46060 [Ktedonobacteraceae bacterium]|nr:hypothetical protein [Ktedonobacteraceae bacterium]